MLEPQTQPCSSAAMNWFGRIFKNQWLSWFGSHTVRALTYDSRPTDFQPVSSLAMAWFDRISKNHWLSQPVRQPRPGLTKDSRTTDLASLAAKAWFDRRFKDHSASQFGSQGLVWHKMQEPLTQSASRSSAAMAWFDRRFKNHCLSQFSSHGLVWRKMQEPLTQPTKLAAKVWIDGRCKNHWPKVKKSKFVLEFSTKSRVYKVGWKKQPCMWNNIICIFLCEINGALY